MMISFGPPRDEPDSSLPLQKVGKTNITPDFIFVNEATYSPGLKALNRQRVRSRARSKAAKLLIQKHQTIRLKKESKALGVVAPQERGHGASLPRVNNFPLTIRRRRRHSRSDGKHLVFSNKPPCSEYPRRENSRSR